MMKVRFAAAILTVACILSSCLGETERTVTETEDASVTQEDLTDNGPMDTDKLQLMIDGSQVPVTWEKNDSTEALMALCETGSLVIRMTMYGGFEQVGSIGQSLPSDDEQITTQSGDIVLYSDDQIVLFYGSNTWDYTRLGRMELSAPELSELLGNEDVVIELFVQ